MTEPTITHDCVAGRVRNEVAAAVTAGLCVVPPAEDGSKAPIAHLAKWGHYRQARPTDAEYRTWYPDLPGNRGRTGLGLIKGKASGNAEAWDFDDLDTYHAFIEAAIASGLGPLVQRIEEGYCDETPGNGRRWILRCDGGVPYERTIVAKRPKRADETADKVLIELPEHTILAPSSGGVHPTGKPYVRLCGGFPMIETVSTEDRQALVALARSFDEMPVRAKTAVGAAPGKSEGNRPGDEFNRRATWAEILHGWTAVYARGEVTYWCRPGKREGHSATTNIGGSDLLYVFSSSTPFEPDTSYSKFAAHAVLEHGGDFARASKALASAGYGDQPRTTPEAAQNAQSADPQPFPASWRLLNEVQLMSLPDPEWLIDGFLPRRGVAVVYGPSGAAKTTFIAGLSTAVANVGLDFYGHAVKHRGGVVCVTAEDPAGFKVRLRAAKAAAHLPLATHAGVYTFPEPIDLRDPVAVALLTRFLQQSAVTMPLELLIVDTYAAATPGASENSSEDTTLAMAHAQQWRDKLGVTVILVHHTNAGGSRERGHSAMRGAADLMVSITPVDDSIHVECSKLRNGAPFLPFTLKLVPVSEGGCVLRLASDVLPSLGLTPAQQKAYATLRETFGADGPTKSEWQRACQDIPERTFHRAAKELVEKGLVRPVGSHFRLAGTDSREAA